jgi:hypothetical protein
VYKEGKNMCRFSGCACWGCYCEMKHSDKGCRKTVCPMEDKDECGILHYHNSENNVDSIPSRLSR